MLLTYRFPFNSSIGIFNSASLRPFKDLRLKITNFYSGWDI